MITPAILGIWASGLLVGIVVTRWVWWIRDDSEELIDQVEEWKRNCESIREQYLDVSEQLFKLEKAAASFKVDMVKPATTRVEYHKVWNSEMFLNTPAKNLEAIKTGLSPYQDQHVVLDVKGLAKNKQNNIRFTGRPDKIMEELSLALSSWENKRTPLRIDLQVGYTKLVEPKIHTVQVPIFMPRESNTEMKPSTPESVDKDNLAAMVEVAVMEQLAKQRTRIVN